MPKKSYQDLQNELAQAQSQLEEMRALDSGMQQQDLSASLMEEMRKLNSSQTVMTGGIPVRTIDDHRNIPLYTQLNKVIGPLHPHNAKQTMERFYAAGYPLFITPRTPQQVEEYRNSSLGKAREAQRQKEYERKKSNTKQGRINELAKIVAIETGKAVSNVVLPKAD
jgi:hypothetical protein